jgi:uncharacterized protein (TIGR03086 family)
MSAMRNWDDEVAHLLVIGRDREAAELAVRHLVRQSVEQGAPMEPLAQLDLLAPPLGTVIAGIGDDQLDMPTPCDEFTVEGVLDHMLSGAVAFSAAFQGETPGPLPTGVDKRALVGGALGSLVEAMHRPHALEQEIAAPFGVVPGEAFARFVVLDGLVHGWDLATATGQPYDPPEALVRAVQAFADEALPPLRNGETFGKPTPAPDTASPIERLAAFTGRSLNGGQQ